MSLKLLNILRTIPMSNFSSVTQSRVAIVIALFNNMRSLKFKSQPLPSIKSSVALPSFRLLPSARSLSIVQTTKPWMAEVGSWKELPSIWLMVTKKAFVGWAWNFRVHKSLKGAEMPSGSRLPCLCFSLKNNNNNNNRTITHYRCYQSHHCSYFSTNFLHQSVTDRVPETITDIFLDGVKFYTLRMCCRLWLRYRVPRNRIVTWMDMWTASVCMTIVVFLQIQM